MQQVEPGAYLEALGKTYVDSVTQRGDRAALRIGRDEWSRYEVASRLQTTATRACSILSSIAKQLKVTSTADLYKSTSPYTFASYPAGVTTLHVLFAAFRDRDLDPEAWYRQGQEAAIVSFFALKHREQQAERRTREDAKRRQRRTRNSRHNHAVDRVLSKAGAK